MILHILNKSTSHQAYQLCLQALAPQDHLLLIEDGTYCALQELQGICPDRINQIQCHVMERDAQTRGIVALLHPRFTCIDDTGFVTLVTMCDKSISWY